MVGVFSPVAMASDGIIVSIIAQERGYAFVLNSDKQAVTFVNPAMGEDITEAVKQAIHERDTKDKK